MKPEQEHKNFIVEEPNQAIQGFAHLSEDQKLLLEVKKSGIEKLLSFTMMIRRNTSDKGRSNR